MVYFSIFGPNTVTASFTLGPLLGISSNSCINIIYSKNRLEIAGMFHCAFVPQKYCESTGQMLLFSLVH